MSAGNDLRIKLAPEPRPFQMHSQPWSSMLLDLVVASHPHDLTHVPTTSATNSRLKHD